jgi:hypothetical protein
MKKTILRLISLALILLIGVSGVSATQWWDPLAVERQVYTFLSEELKLSSAAACGILANIEYESAFQVTIIGDQGTSFGLCQWHNERYTALRSFCMARGLDYRTVEGQMAYLAYELKSTYLALYGALRSVENSSEGAYRAAYLWCIQFERPADMERKAVIRGNAARYKYWNRYNSVIIVGEIEEPNAAPDPEDMMNNFTGETPELIITPKPETPEQTDTGYRYEVPRPEADRLPYFHGPTIRAYGSNGYTGFAVGVLFMTLGDGRRFGWYLPDPEEREEDLPEDTGKMTASHLHIPAMYDMIEPKRRNV